MKKAFVSFYVGYEYERMTNLLKESIETFSDKPLIVFTPKDFDLEFLPENWKPGYIYIYKILSCLKLLEEFDEVVWLDSDCLVTHNIEKIRDYKIDKFPLLPRARFYNFVNWPMPFFECRSPHFMGAAKQKVECFDLDFPDVYLQACCMFINKDCEPFLREVLSFFEDFDGESFFFGDESIINSLFWKYKNSKNLGDVFLCSHYFSSYIFDSFITLQKAEDFPKLFDPSYDGIFPIGTHPNIELNTHNRLKLIHNNFENILFFHGTKSYDKHENYLDSLKIYRK